MKDYTNPTIIALCEQLNLLAEDVSEDARRLILEASNQLELLDIENADLGLSLSIEKQNVRFWSRKTTGAVSRIHRLEAAGDAMAIYATAPTKAAWNEAKNPRM